MDHTPPVLRLVGYWASEEDSRWPEIHAFVANDWDPEERSVVLHHLLSQGVKFVQFAEASWCRMGCGAYMGAGELTDGVYVWPEGLAHYLTEHTVRLPEEFVAHCRHFSQNEQHRKAIAWFADPAVEDKTVDIDWWLSFR